MWGRMLVTECQTLDQILNSHRMALAHDFNAYRNHAYRVLNLCSILQPVSDEQMAKLAVSAAFHDLGMWTHRTFDYLEPSACQACEYVNDTGNAGWQGEIAAVIHQHHKITKCRGESTVLAEVFRRADWIDVSRGVISFGIARARLAEVFCRWPDAGLHKLLIRRFVARLGTHPWAPLPMVKI